MALHAFMDADDGVDDWDIPLVLACIIRGVLVVCNLTKRAKKSVGFTFEIPDELFGKVDDGRFTDRLVDKQLGRQLSLESGTEKIYEFPWNQSTVIIVII